MARHKVKKLIYSSTCATYGEPEKMSIVEVTPQVLSNSSRMTLFRMIKCLMRFWQLSISQVPINPYGKAKKMAEDMILDFSKNSDMAVMILRFSVLFFFFFSEAF